MRHYRGSCVGVLMLSLSLVALVSQARAHEPKHNPTGTYTWERTRGDRLIKSSLTLKLVGHKLTGSFKSRDNEIKIENAKLDGDKVSFQVTRSFGDRQVTFKYAGKLTASGIKGTRTTGRG